MRKKEPASGPGDGEENRSLKINTDGVVTDSGRGDDDEITLGFFSRETHRQRTPNISLGTSVMQRDNNTQLFVNTRASVVEIGL